MSEKSNKKIIFQLIIICTIIFFTFGCIFEENDYDRDLHHHAQIRIMNVLVHNNSLNSNHLRFSIALENDKINVTNENDWKRHSAEIFDLKDKSYPFSIEGFQGNQKFRFFGKNNIIFGNATHNNDDLIITIDNGNKMDITFNPCYSSGKYFLEQNHTKEFVVNIPGFHSLNLNGTDGVLEVEFGLWYPPP